MTCCYDNVQSPEKWSVSFISLPAAVCSHSSIRAFINPHKDHPEDISWAQGTEDLPRIVSFKLKQHCFQKILLEPKNSLYWNWGTKSIKQCVWKRVSNVAHLGALPRSFFFDHPPFFSSPSLFYISSSTPPTPEPPGWSFLSPPVLNPVPSLYYQVIA